MYQFFYYKRFIHNQRFNIFEDKNIYYVVGYMVSRE